MLNRGFTLIEVLVTLVILTFGLLGIAGLMAKGQRASFEAFQRQQATSMASDMAERVRANRSQTTAVYSAQASLAAPLGQGASYSNLLTEGIKDCGTYPCSTAELAAYDIALWDGLLTGYSETQVAGGARVGGIVNARGCVVSTTNANGTCTVRISVAWQGNEETVAPTASTCGQGVYIPDAIRRITVLDLMVPPPC